MATADIFILATIRRSNVQNTDGSYEDKDYFSTLGLPLPTKVEAISAANKIIEEANGRDDIKKLYIFKAVSLVSKVPPPTTIEDL